MPAELIGHVKRSFDGQKIALRSSSFDEDTPLIGPAPGVYESVTDVDSTNEEAILKVLKDVVASFFSDKAISFRELKGLRHKPVFAVLVQAFVDNVGGTVFINNGNIELNVASRPSMVNNHSKLFEALSVLNGAEPLFESRFLTPEQSLEIVGVARKAEEIFGSNDIEFVVDPKSKKIKILQLRALQQQTPIGDKIEAPGEPSSTIQINSLDNLPDIEHRTNINIQIGPEVNLETFQGVLFRWLTINRQTITSITLERRIPTTCHFANVIVCLGINLRFFE